MLRIVTIPLVVMMLALGTPPSVAAAEAEAAGRYTMNPVEDGMLRLDTRTGAVSLCRRADERWACEAVPDSHLQLQQQLDRQTDENEALQREIDDLKARLQLAERHAGKPEVERRGPNPGDEAVDQMMSVLEGMIRRFQDMVESLERDPSEKQL